MQIETNKSNMKRLCISLYLAAWYKTNDPKGRQKPRIISAAFLINAIIDNESRGIVGEMIDGLVGFTFHNGMESYHSVDEYLAELLDVTLNYKYNNDEELENIVREIEKN